MMSMMAPKMITEDFEPGIEARLHAKDVGIAYDTAADQHLSLPCLEFVHQQYQSIMENGLGSRDSSVLFDQLKGLKQR